MVLERTNFLKKGRYVLVNKKQKTINPQQKRQWIFLISFLLTGFILGIILSGMVSDSTLEKLNSIFLSDFGVRIEHALQQVFIASLGSSFLLLLFCFLMGLSAWGMFFIFLIPFFKGIGLGLTCGYLYLSYGIKGILCFLVLILPGALLCSFALLLGTREGMFFSKKMATYSFFPLENKPVCISLSKYILRFGMILIIAVCAAIVDAVISTFFATFFSFN